MSAKSRPKPGWYVVGTPGSSREYIVVVSGHGPEVWITASTKQPCTYYYYNADKSPFLNPTDWEVTPL